MSADPAAPTTELGSSNPQAQGQLVVTGLPSWSFFYGDDLENVPELQWPQSVRVYHMMRNDTQLNGLLVGSMLPIRRYRWVLEKNGARPEVVRKIADDYGLQVEGEDPPDDDGNRRFEFDEHLRLALLSLAYGHMYFEQVGEIREDMLWHCLKVPERMPNTISEIATDRDGGLKYIRQQHQPLTTPPIGVERLIAYVWDREGANWAGRSLLRPCYKNWLVKDQTLRTGTINIQRAGAGVPVATAPPGATPAQIEELNKMAQAYKVGEASGGALPHGATLSMEGIRGSQPDAAGWIRLQNEEMARSFLEMFMQLGQTETGSRALGSEFIDYFRETQETIAGWFAKTFTKYQIKKDVNWNWGEDERPPKLKFINEEPELAAAVLAQLVSNNVIQMDDDLEGAVRERFRLPPRTEPRQTAPAIPPPGEEPEEDDETSPEGTQAKRRGGGAAPRLTATSSLALPTRTLRREPYDHEVRAQVDFAEMDAQWQSNRDALVFEVKMLQEEQVAELHDAIVSADADIAALAALQATPNSKDAIQARMIVQAEQGAQQAHDEANRQGVKGVKKGKVKKAKKELAERADATAAVLARGLSEAAAKKAITLTGGALVPSEVADEVASHLRSLSSSYLEEQLGGVLTQAQNTGRRLTFRDNEPERYYASELLDANTCESCVAKDGTDYLELTDAERDYPTGGFKDCKGGVRCRGSVIAVYPESAPTLEVPGV